MKPASAFSLGAARRLVGVADFRPFSHRIALFDSDGHRGATENLPRIPDVGRMNRHELADVAFHVIKEKSQLFELTIIATTAQSDHLRVERISIYPVPISIVPEILAAAHAVPDSWSSFQVIDYRSRIWWLIEKKDGVYAARFSLFSRLTGPTCEVRDHFEAMGFTNAAVLGEGDAVPNALMLDLDALLSGAQRAWQRHEETEGVHICLDKNAREVLQVDAIHRLRYKIVHVDQPVFSLEEDALADFIGGRPVLFAVDKKVNAIYGESLDVYSRERLNCAGKLVISGCEDCKTWSEVDWICREAARLSFPRHGVLISVGGGVALDVAGFAASVYRRGIRYLRVPTSLIGLVDAGLGVKQGVNFLNRKNFLGAFYPPIGAITDPSFLTSLSGRDISCGIAEIIKIALVRDGRLFELLEEHGGELLKSRFRRPTQIAARLVRTAQVLMLEELQPNLYETNLVRLVDFGHTFSPAIEMQTGCDIAHGEAVALDMLLSTAIAVDRGLCADELFHRMVRLYEQVGLPTGPMPCSAEQLVFAVGAARLHRGGDLNLVVPVRAGQAVFLQDIDRADLETALLRLSSISNWNLEVGFASSGV